MGRTKEVLDLEPIEDRWIGMGWNTERIDGHDYEMLEECIPAKNEDKPKVIICDTIKGRGVSFFEDHLLYHYKHVDDETYQKALTEL